ncbi:dTDP-4-amino-4,6-dideoxy-D-galactose acyltransferase [Acerihabitans arboris]|uniref:dTDP-4-amino-4,6-dideoxy-D-galactose acyltransferase n=1 Tax=Acerihabitans arboris TaxID=2691583 RepID=A0A845SN36_9GAMM|nr:dTDP-4-amino-4,6-dideoxy-D-galactose acyltransferase [Acerihabitans arboris]NDL64366.1 dTDP-4-amino-4,6-dideoxy-D-galactose acyltransferase [Acerihabitans arboris]
MPLHATIEPLGWESDFFNVSSGKIIVNPAAAPLSGCALDAFQVVQAKVAADAMGQADALAELGFRLVEGEIDCSLRVPKRCGRGDGAHGDLADSAQGDLADRAVEGSARLPGGAPYAGHLRIAGRGDNAAVSRLASSAFRLSRFREPWYREQDRRRFYAVWAQNAILGTFDDLCLVKGRPGAIEGMVTLRRLGADDARIGLLAVDPAFTRRGVGRVLFAGALAWCRLQGISRLRVATQAGNLAALRLYIACGATVDSTAYWLYR